MFRTKLFLAILLTLLVSVPNLAWSQDKVKEIVVTIKTADSASAPFSGDRPAVDIALLLDTSNSMDGLINQAKTQLWTIVQQFAKAKRDGKTPRLRVSLFEYGNTGLPASEGYIRQVIALSDDLDEISEALFALSTNGGDEYCGQVIDEAIKRLDWCKEPNTYKAIFIAGNEPFTQGSVDYRDACKKAIESGVIVNTIHCGDRSSGISGQWKDGADLAEGKFFNIDQDKTIVHIDCPQDVIILRLNSQLNKTYLWYGAREVREGRGVRQEAQDANAYGLGAAPAVRRAAAKVSSAYNNASRDLVDAVASNERAIESIEVDQLPEDMQAMNAAQRKEHVEKLAKQRKELQDQIAKLAKEREQFLDDKRNEMAEESGTQTLGDVVVQAISEQLVESGFTVED